MIVKHLKFKDLEKAFSQLKEKPIVKKVKVSPSLMCAILELPKYNGTSSFFPIQVEVDYNKKNYDYEFVY